MTWGWCGKTTDIIQEVHRGWVNLTKKSPETLPWRENWRTAMAFPPLLVPVSVNCLPKTLTQITLAGILLLTSFGCRPSLSSTPPAAVSSLPLTTQVTIGSTDILLEVAKTPEEQAQGLMFRTELPGDRGMLFDFEAPRVARFWMKNTLIPLDMIFLRQGRVKRIIANVPPCKADPCPVYGPLTEVDQVLELGAGQAEALGLTVNQRLEFVPIAVSDSE